MNLFDRELRYLKGVGEKRAGLFAKLGVFTVGDILRYFPRAYEDRREIAHITDLTPGMSVCVRGTVVTDVRQARISGGRQIVRFRISDESGQAEVMFFNQGWVKDRIRRGGEYIFYGEFREMKNSRMLSLVNPVYEAFSVDKTGTNTQRIMPVYRLTSGIGQNYIRGIVETALRLCEGNLEDVLSESIRERYVLQNAELCYKNIHFPGNGDLLADARRRFVFEELLVLSLGLRRMRGRRNAVGYAIPEMDMSGFEQVLSFKLTGAQQRAIRDVAADMSSGYTMNRLIQGDVGSGKTMVAAAAAWLACGAGVQAAVMAPTEILASQHYETLAPIFERLNMRTALLVGSMSTASKRKTVELAATGELDVLIGTHALISEGVEFKKLGLVVTDEQHRFGVAQRAALAEKGNNAHMLVMSATPIPRTLALMLYGDLDISRIDELPPGRRPVQTFAVSESYRPRVEKFIRKLVGEGRQVFIVCPLVEEVDGLDDGRKTVETYAEHLSREVFPELRVEFIHGRMKPAKKDEIMRKMSAGEIDILVSTTVIEVGIDVPNAALIIIENSERFGLAQLHQLRGRVGRGSHESYCILFENGGSQVTRERIRVMCETNDGFKIAEEDLRLRGPGDFFGSRQHGIPALRIADIAADNETMSQVSEAAGLVLADDPELTRPENALLRREVDKMFENAGELN